ncbi:TIR domain-containing protein [Aliamphritea spongicola]|nr:TIR domain-containing protein [Aliamphritea spongicola]
MSQPYKVFVSYHHASDQAYRDRFEQLFADDSSITVSPSEPIGDIDEYEAPEYIRQIVRDDYLRDTTVTVVLIGSDTWRRRYVDWEIGSSVRHTEHNPCSGLVGILLPSYQPPAQSQLHTAAYRNAANNHHRKYFEKPFRHGWLIMLSVDSQRSTSGQMTLLRFRSGFTGRLLNVPR